ncbi:hypothetical protein [Arthrobacter sp. ISL-5]|uniref:hypothetical protein n=1 Tax=Arthrobacter sp. ISL-5 TaxID=2819111 RepID=UPI001BE5874F|nr:hypothetical protein [Arthrobacter sp. ISL-5]MBT2555907.1 hypothetical protein [Arthrobacter sp. ISL-5]
MSGKSCGECGERFVPSRTSQRFCSTRCANRQRDRRRRQRLPVASPASAVPARRRITVAESGPTPTRRKSQASLLTASAGIRQHQQKSLGTQLRSQAADIDRLEAENADQRGVIRNLRADVARLQTIQQTDARDLVHLAGRLLAHSRTTGVELHISTKALFRRRGWTATNRNLETQKP